MVREKNVLEDDLGNVLLQHMDTWIHVLAFPQRFIVAMFLILFPHLLQPYYGAH